MTLVTKNDSSLLTVNEQNDLLSCELVDISMETMNLVGKIKPGDTFLTKSATLPRGIAFDIPKEYVSTVQERPLSSININISSKEQEFNSLNNEEVVEPIDDLIPKKVSDIKFSSPNAGLFTKSIHTWAINLDINKLPCDYELVVSDPALTFPFELDLFQKQAVYHLEKSESVFVAAHTSAGKTAIAEYAIALARRHLTRAIYTSPIKALSNQKFRDFKQQFGEVGLLTGDVQIAPDSSCLVMTTEILRSMLYRSAEIISEVEYVIFDEVHYVNDQERGVVWEEVIIMLPPHVTLVLLSATIPNCFEFAEWVGRTKSKKVHVIYTQKRPVPLEHFLYVCPGAGTGEVFKIIDQNRNFLEAGFKNALQCKKGEKSVSNVGGGGKVSQNVAQFRNVRQEKSLWSEVVYFLRKKSLLPCVIFTFSRKKCEENATAVSSLDLNSAAEKSTIRIFLDKCIAKLRPEDRELPQIGRMRELLSLGIAVHHSGLLPIMKEAVEILFSKGFLKVLFATETFAMGVNMPARTVVFSTIRKHDGNSFRDLLPGEYTQMAGRAGRRGLDSSGTVIIISPEEIPNEVTLKNMILGTPTKLTSQFRLTYSMVLSLLRVQSIKVEEMIKKSFSENTGQKEMPEDEKKIVEYQRRLNSLEEFTCPICSGDIGQLYESTSLIQKIGKDLWNKILADNRVAEKVFCPGRLIVASLPNHSNVPLVLIRRVDATSISCFLATNKGKSDPPNPNVFPINRVDWPDTRRELECKAITIELEQVVDILDMQIKVPTDLGNTLRYRIKDLNEIESNYFSLLDSDTVSMYQPLNIPSFKLVNLEEKRLQRQFLQEKVSNLNCIQCPDLIEHFNAYFERRQTADLLNEMKFKLSDASLALMPEYHARLDVLHSLDYIDIQGNIQLKGRVACELNTVQELLTTEILFENIFQSCTAAEMVAILSTMVFQEKTSSNKNGNIDVEATLVSLPENLREPAKSMLKIAGKLTELEKVSDIPEPYPINKLNFGLVEVVHEWAKGMPFVNLMTLTEVLEGSIVRCIVRLDETCREIRGAAKIMGDTNLFKKAEEASLLIKRDICFASSLYI